MRRVASLLLAALAWPTSAPAQTFQSRDWLAVCDDTRTCRAAGYSVEGSDNPVSVLIARASGPRMPVVGELQLGVLNERAVHPASVALMVAGKSAATLRIDRNNHADLPPVALAVLLKALTAGADISFAAGKTTWRLSPAGAIDVLQKFDDVQERAGRLSALVRRGNGSDADVASPMAVPRFEAGNIPGVAQPGDDALVVRVLAAIASHPDCPLLDDGAAQARARLWHLDANRVLVTQACSIGTHHGGNGYWTANLRPPYDARALTYAGNDADGTGTITARLSSGAAGDCSTTQSWTWNGFRFEQTYAATGGLCRGVKAGGAWELPSQVSDVIPGR